MSAEKNCDCRLSRRWGGQGSFFFFFLMYLVVLNTWSKIIPCGDWKVVFLSYFSVRSVPIIISTSCIRRSIGDWKPFPHVNTLLYLSRPDGLSGCGKKIEQIMRKELRKKAEGGAWQGMWTIHQQLNKDDGNNKFPLKKKGKVFFFFFFKEIVSPR